MRFDLTVPIGWLFSIYGTLLALYGVLGDSTQYARSLGINVNVWWGLALLTFGVAVLVLRRSK